MTDGSVTGPDLKSHTQAHKNQIKLPNKALPLKYDQDRVPALPISHLKCFQKPTTVHCLTVVCGVHDQAAMFYPA